MRYSFCPVFSLLVFVGTLAAATPPETLTLQDLANRPDHWPATVTFQQDLKFGSGLVIHAGDPLRISHFDGSKLVLITPGKQLIVVKPQDCNLLEAANQVWTALTPAQRAIDPDSLAGDMSLWPVQVTTDQPITCTFGKLPPGTAVGLLEVTNKDLDIVWPKSSNRLRLGFASTDLFDRARQLVLIDPKKRDSRIASALQNMLVDSDGKPYHDAHFADKKIFALYFGAGWCPPCREFSPDLVKYMTDTLPKHPELAAALISNDKTVADMLAYMKEEKMLFPAVPPNDAIASCLLSSYAAQMIPHMIILDRFGKILATSDNAQGNRFDPKDTLTALDKLLTTPRERP